MHFFSVLRVSKVTFDIGSYCLVQKIIRPNGNVQKHHEPAGTTLMHPNLIFQSVHTLLYTCFLLLVTVVYFLMLLETRREGLVSLRRWLVPSTIASTMFFVAWLIRVLAPNLGFRSSALFFFCEYSLEGLATTLAIIAVFRMWRMIQDWPVCVGATRPPSKKFVEHHEGVWPPPPTSPS